MLYQYLAENSTPQMHYKNTTVDKKYQYGGRTRKRRFTHKKWSDIAPGEHDRTVMMSRCGPSCFLGLNKTFPICARHTCKINKKGIQAAYVRAREYMSMRPGVSKYRRISKRAKRMKK